MSGVPLELSVSASGASIAFIHEHPSRVYTDHQARRSLTCLEYQVLKESLFGMLSVLARSSQNALRSLRPVAGVASAIAPTCKRTSSTNVPPTERPSFSQLEIPDARPVRSELWGAIGKTEHKSPEEIWAQRESTRVSQLDAPPDTWSGMYSNF